MKDRQIALPSLHAAAIAFFAARAVAAEGSVACADANDVVVAAANCDGSHPAGTFFRFDSGLENPPVGSVIDPETTKFDAADLTKRQGSEAPPPDFVAGGFGRRQCNDGSGGSSGCSTGG
ncbi:hypothetical protein LZ30DRAFT_782806 [Colletotrichum cereale]|nr:hypothetical protein LZ30DRAFT_782806 [Colletotrichum cereale]